MADSTNDLSQTTLILYDSTGHILHATDVHPPYSLERIVGLPAWHALNAADANICQAALMRCAASGKPQTFDVDVNPIGRWRTTLHRCRVGKTRMIGIARKVPEAILVITDRQRQICALLASGFTSREIARALDIARETVDNHRAAVAKRVGIKPWALIAWCGEHREWLCGNNHHSPSGLHHSAAAILPPSD